MSSSLSAPEIDTIIECAVNHFWMTPLTIPQRINLIANLEKYPFDNNDDANAVDDTQNINIASQAAHITISQLTIHSLSRMTPIERKLIFIDLGFDEKSQLPQLLRACQECAELVSLPKAASAFCFTSNNNNKNNNNNNSATFHPALRFVNTTTAAQKSGQPAKNPPRQQQLQQQSSNAVASLIAWDATEWTAAAGSGQVVLGSHPSLDYQMRELFREIYKNNRETKKIASNFPKQHQQQQQQEENVSTSAKNTGSSSSNNSVKNNNLHAYYYQGVLASGIRNQGATCYLNSLIQVLFHLPKLRQVVFSVDTKTSSENNNSNNTNDDNNNNNTSAFQISKSLQRLFVSMEMYREKSILLLNSTSQNNIKNSSSSSSSSLVEVPETKELTSSFGWTANEAFVQHDIHECATMMLERLEDSMTNKKNTNNNNENISTSNENDDDETNEIAKLFKLKIKSYFRTIDIDYESAHMNSPLYLSLPMRNCPTIYHSLDTYFQEQLLDGSSKLCVERNGKKSYHPAKAGTVIEKAPPVILLFLMRSDFDPQTGEPCKVTSRNEYYDTLDIKKYMTPSSSSSSKTKYSLQAVVVHNGSDAGFGHYYAYSKVHVDREVCEKRDDLRHFLPSSSSSSASSPNQNNNNNNQDTTKRPRVWVKLNDETVSIASDYEVFGSNFGGTKRNYWGGTETVTTSAAMLVYVREGQDVDDNILFDPYSCNNASFIPKSLREQFDREEREAEERQIRIKELRTQISLWAIDLNSDLFSDSLFHFFENYGSTAEADKWLFGCPWNIFMNKDKQKQQPKVNDKATGKPKTNSMTQKPYSGGVHPKWIGNFQKQQKIDEEINALVRTSLLESNESPKQQQPQLDTFLICYSPESGNSVESYYSGPTRILSGLDYHSISNVGNGLVFFIQQPKFSSSSSTNEKYSSTDNNNNNKQKVVTYHRFYDPINEKIVPLFAMISEIDGNNHHVVPKSLLPQVLEFVQFRIKNDEERKSEFATTDSSIIKAKSMKYWTFIEASLKDSLTREQASPELNGTVSSNVFLYREEQPGSIYSFPHDATKILSGTTYIWQPNPDFEMTRQEIFDVLSIFSTSSSNIDDIEDPKQNNSNDNKKNQSNKQQDDQEVVSGINGSSTNDDDNDSSSVPESPTTMMTTTNSNRHLSQQNQQDFPNSSNPNSTSYSSSSLSKQSIKAATRFPTVDRYSSYQRNKCTIKLASADFRKGFSVVAVVEASGTATFDEFMEIVIDALKQKKEKLGLPIDDFTKFREFSNNTASGSSGNTNTLFSYHVRIGKNSNPEGPEVPPTNAIHWFRRKAWSSLNFALKANEKSGTLFFDLVRVYPNKNNINDDVVPASSASSSSSSPSLLPPLFIHNEDYDCQKNALLAFEFFDSIAVRPFSRHHLLVDTSKNSYGSFSSNDLLRWCQDVILEDYRAEGILSSSSSSSSFEQTGLMQQNDSATPKRNDDVLALQLLSPKKKEMSLMRNLQILVDLSEKSKKEGEEGASGGPLPQLLDIWNGRIYNTFSFHPDEKKSAIVKSLEGNSDYRFEIDFSGNNNNSTQTRITIVHFSMMKQQNNSNTNNNNNGPSFVPSLHGEPFYHFLEPGETISRCRLRIAERLSLTVERVERWHAKFVGSGGFNPVSLTENDANNNKNNNSNEVPIEKQMNQARDRAVNNSSSSVNVRKGNFEIWLGLEHAPLPGTRAQAGRRGNEERAFSIN